MYAGNQPSLVAPITAAVAEAALRSPTAARDGLSRAWAPTDVASADPAVLLAAVRRLGTVKFAGKTGSGARALDTYNFRYNIAGDASLKPHRPTGTIVVHDQSNLIAAITMQTSVTGANPQIADGGRLTFKTVMTFSDYGVPVSVQAPAGARAMPRKF